MHLVRNWTGFPRTKTPALFFRTERELRKLLKEERTFIPHGSGRSYGDCCLGRAALVSRRFAHLLEFDSSRGILRCESGLTLREVINFALPRGWFPGVVPGTAHITVGGAIAGDVHGKNHHIAGCFSRYVLEIKLMLPTGDVVTTRPGDKLFHATCGGMGLTGIILEAVLQLRPVRSGLIKQLLFITRNLAETLELFDRYRDMSFSAGWLDGTASGKSLGRSVVMFGDFAEEGPLEPVPEGAGSVPPLPVSVISNVSIKMFNRFHLLRSRFREGESLVSIGEFFFPLDSLSHWYRLYGRRGFLQYQFVLPLARGAEGLEEVLHTVIRSGIYPSLAVLKRFGPENENMLSFPMEGYTLALDFPISRDLFRLLDSLDRLVLKYGGRIYLCKDARMNREVFEAGYPRIDEFRRIRKEYDLRGRAESFLSRRLEI